MIGVVVADPSEHEVVREFFELFKTPWEFSQVGRQYDVLLCAGEGHVPGATAKLVLIYSGEPGSFDSEAKVEIGSERTNAILSYRGTRIPIYGRRLTFRDEGIVGLKDEASQGTAAYVVRFSSHVLLRVGYDLFREIRALLTVG